MGLSERLRALRADIARHLPQGAGGAQAVVACLETQGIWAASVYRYGQWVYERPRGALGVPLKVSYRVSHKLVEVAAGISIPASARIGEGLYVGHFGEVIVHPEVVAGRNLSIGQGVTLGTRGVGSQGAPVLGDDVYVGVGAKILGAVRVGDGARIGAGAVVLEDVPAGATVGGVPARVLKRRGEGA
jgi:serine O-acetyltransferase